MSDNILMWDVCETYTTYICDKNKLKIYIKESK